ncbi:WYL domain-containing protein [Psychromonas sp.]|uniref:WYL domain-containing protein n=1 Tax=Psychromonas sp. TaxID=1884585 RepID=UPI003563F707
MARQEKIFQLIDALLMWEGQFNASDLMELLSVSRGTAQNSITSYKKQFPNHYAYSQSAKTNLVSEFFSAHHWQGNFRDYQLLLGKKSSSNLTDIDTVCSLHNPLHHKTLRILNHACRKKLTLEVDYGSLSDAGNVDGRIIAPHNIVMDGLRAHVRAYCFKNNAYRDFIVGRFRSMPIVEDRVTGTIGPEFDVNWNTRVELVICADPALSHSQKENIEMEYQMVNGQRIVETPVALLPYVMKRLRLDTRQQTPEAQQLIIEPGCYKKIKGYLPH